MGVAAPEREPVAAPPTHCFKCLAPGPLDGHRVCEACHHPARCRREACAEARHGGSAPHTVRPVERLLAALRARGGTATTAELAADTGLRPRQVAASCKNGKGIDFVATGARGTSSYRRWVLAAPATSA